MRFVYLEKLIPAHSRTLLGFNLNVVAVLTLTDRNNTISISWY